MKHLLTIVLLFFVINLFSQIQVTADFEGGNVEVLSIINSTNTITIIPALNTSTNTTRCWFYFKVSGFDKDSLLTINIKYDRKVMAPEYPVFSYNKKNWTKVKSKYTYGKKTISYQFTEDTVYFATGFPYVYSDVISYSDKIAENPNVDTTTLTISEGGRRVPKYVISNGKGKDLVWIIARQHAFESMSNFVVEGIVDYIASEDSLAVEFRKQASLHVVPMMDVDNVAIGASGRMQRPIDMNRDWNPESHWKAVKEVKKQLEETSSENNYRVFIDVHSTFPGATYPIFSYFNMYNGTDNLQNLERYWQVFYQYSNISPQKLSEIKFTEGNILADEYSSGLDCEKNGIPCFDNIDFSFTMECDWNNRPDAEQWTQESLYQTGQYMGKALCKYITSDN